MALAQLGVMDWIVAAAALGAWLVWLQRSRRPPRKAARALASPLAADPHAPPFTGPPTYPNRPQMELVDNGQVRVTKILVHPIKSCRGTSVPEVRYTPQGLENDRKWAVYDPAENKILTAREVPKLVLVEPSLKYDTSSPTRGKLVVTAGSESFSVPIEPTQDILTQWEVVQDPYLFGRSTSDAYIIKPLSPADPAPSAVLSSFLGRAVHLVVKGPTPRYCKPTQAFPTLEATAVFQDGYPVLIASEESLEAVAAAVNNAARPDAPEKVGGIDQARWQREKVPIERFRPNIVVRGAGVPFAEDVWQKIYINSPGSTTKDESKSFTLVSQCPRCLLPNVDPKTGVRDAAVPFKVISKFRTGVNPEAVKTPCFGSNSVPGGNGVVRVGDRISVEEWLQL
ncbi:hypothetical protein PsYK624_055530 [Phanerochaete sordida]|uniref:MOSC domain-containing protein n=1 Tax=Phanerochaete sordida TaxID=48140 RepID=A0A9P3G5A3_9APHY|nr:hypothetical protein PsYK624_055530 [Phanerochaete sordida]